MKIKKKLEHAMDLLGRVDPDWGNAEWWRKFFLLTTCHVVLKDEAPNRQYGGWMFVTCEDDLVGAIDEVNAPKKRGRKLGSKNKPKVEVALPVTAE
jgi:hypothetical protein